MAAREGYFIASIHAPHLFEVQGVNNRVQLAALERIYQENLARDLWDISLDIIVTEKEVLFFD